MKRATIILLSLCVGCESRNLVVITSGPNGDTSEYIGMPTGPSPMPKSSLPMPTGRPPI